MRYVNRDCHTSPAYYSASVFCAMECMALPACGNLDAKELWEGRLG